MQVRQINVAPGGGVARFRIPSSYPYVTVMNNSDYTIEVQADGETVFTMPLYTILTLPIGVAFRGNDKSVNYDFIYSGGVTTTTIDILFNEHYMPLNQTLSTPGGGGMVIIAAQAAGMATELKQDATIAALAAAATAANQAAGNALLTDIKALDTSITALLTAIRDTAGIKKITEQLPPGTNNIGDMDVLTVASGQVLKPAKVWAMANVAAAAANTQYTAAIPAGTRAFSISCAEGDSAFRIAAATGKVAGPTVPYRSIPAGGEYYKENIEPGASITVYIASATAGKNFTIETWR